MTSSTPMNSEDLYVLLQKSGSRSAIESDYRLMYREAHDKIPLAHRTASRSPVRAEIASPLTYQMITFTLGNRCGCFT